MSVERIPNNIRTGNLFSHIDMGFLNRRLAITALGPVRNNFLSAQTAGNDHMTRLRNDHLLVTMLIDVYSSADTPTLSTALSNSISNTMIMSTERLSPCPDVYNENRVKQQVILDLYDKKPVYLCYHTEHLVSSTGTMTLSEGFEGGYVESIIGRLKDYNTHWEIEPIVIGSPWLDHPRNESFGRSNVMFFGRDYGEILAEDIQQFERLTEVTVESASEWMDAMRKTPENKVKESFASLLNEPVKKDWGGEENDHFSSNILIGGRRCTCAFLLKGPTNFSEMTPAMCGKNGDQIYRLVGSGADVSVVQHSHLIGTAVRETLRSMVVTPGRPRKFCVIDGQCTYRILKAYGFV